MQKLEDTQCYSLQSSWRFWNVAMLSFPIF
jgi:hypothetical protein